jgi:hypothetical protein
MFDRARRGASARAYSPYQGLVKNFAKEEQEKSDKKAGLWSFLDFVGDVLSRTQYLTVNTAEEAIKAARGEKSDILGGAWEGITGKRKGTWKHTLFGGRDVGETEDFKGLFNTPEWMKKKGDAPILSSLPIVGGFFKDVSAEDAIGFLADVVLDVGNIGFGATKAGKAAADAFGKKAVLMEIKKTGVLGELFKLTKGAAKKVDLQKLVTSNEGEAFKMLRDIIPQNSKMSRHLNNVYEQAVKQAKRYSPQALQAEYAKKIGQLSDDFLQGSVATLTARGKKDAADAIMKLAEAGKTMDSAGLKRVTEIMGQSKVSKKDLPEVYTELLKEIGASGADITGKVGGAGKAYGGMLKTMSGVPEEFSKMGALGERGYNYLWHEWGKKNEPGPIAQSYRKFMDMIGNSDVVKKMKDSKPGQFVTDIAYDVVHQGPIGWLRKAFGIRNPYEKMVNDVSLQHGRTYRKVREDIERRIAADFGDNPEELLRKARDVMTGMEEARITDPLEVLARPDIMKRLGLEEAGTKEAAGVIGKYKKLMDDMFQAEEVWRNKGLLGESGYRDVYLPAVRKNPPAAGKGGIGTVPSFTKEKQFQFGERVEQEISRFMNMFGFDRKTAEKAVKELNWSTLNTDLMEMLLIRSNMHARAVANASFLEQVSQFGFKFGTTPAPNIIKTAFDDADPVELVNKKALVDGLVSKGASIPEMGVRKSNVAALSDYFFDDEVARMIDGVGQVYSREDVLGKLARFVGGAVSWWKGMATLSPGFHLRNAKNNLWVDFVKHGPSAFNPATQMRSAIGAAYGLYGDKMFQGKVADVMGKMGFTDPLKVRKVLKEEINGKTFGEWIEMAREEGLISRVNMGFNPEEIAENIRGKVTAKDRLNILGNKNIAFKANREVGAVVESSAKLHFFMNEIRQMSGDAAPTADVIARAVNETRRYLFDYEDLTGFEKGVRDSFIPFITWIKKNFILNMTTLVENHAQMAILIKYGRNKAMEGIDMADLPEYVRELGGIPVGQEGDNVRVEYPQLGMQEINKMPIQFDVDGEFPRIVSGLGDVRDEFLAMAHPAVKTALTVFGSPQGYDPFRKKDLDSKSPAPRVMRLFAMSPPLMQIMDAMLVGVGYEKGLGMEKDEKGKLLIDAKVAYVLETNFPLLQRIDQVGDAITSFIPQIEEEMAKITGYSHDLTEVNKRLKTISFLMGVSEKEYDLARVELQRQRDILEKAEKRAREEMRKLPGSEQRLRRYLRSEDRKLRKYGVK